MTPDPRRTPPRWRPNRHLRNAVAGGVAGSAVGLLFGVLSLNRPVANALVFYLLGFLVGALVAGGLSLVAGRRPDTPRPHPRRPGRRRSRTAAAKGM